jgi:glycine hydroxymethyltransferase
VRIGTPAVTSRGMGPAEMDAIAGWFDEVVEAAKKGDEQTIERVRKEVLDLTAQFPAPGLS